MYFFGSYGLGMLAWWHSQSADPAQRRMLLAMMMIMGMSALAIDFRGRIAVSLVTALTLAVSGARVPLRTSRWLAPLYAAGRISYAEFLVHFPVSLVVNATFFRFAAHDPATQAAGMFCAWCASIAAGALFHRAVELPLSRVFGRAFPARMPARARA
jgi:peptidoglycan/LPS O-acetylase OafA/YrhL